MIRDSGPGPVVFRGQIDNGAKVALISVIGSTTWLDEGTAGNLSAEENRVEFSMGDEVLVTVDVDVRRPRHRHRAPASRRVAVAAAHVRQE